jgi:hypothetical protein
LTDARARDAARNNAEWCDTVCRSHGHPGKFEGAVWFDPHETPRFYSNVITLSGSTRSAEQLRCIQDLLAAGLQGEWTVKDSFCALDLAALGFRVLFQAEWMYRPCSLQKPGARPTGVRWARVGNGADLAHWERAWDRELHTEETPRIFLPTLLAEDDHAVIAGYQGDDIVAGCIASRSSAVVGMSNIFVPRHDALTFRAGCIAAVMDLVPELPMVGYERGEGLAAAETLGFEPAGPLRVWIREIAARG